MAQMVIDRLSGGDPSQDSHLDERVVIRYLRMAADGICAGQIAQAWTNGQRTVDSHYIATFNDIVVSAGTGGRNYALIPSYGYISLPNQTGIQRVAPLRADGSYGPAMIPINPNEMDIYGSITENILGKQWYYEPDRGRVWFGKRDGKTLLQAEITKVQIKVVTLDPQSVGSDDPIPIPPEVQLQIIGQVIELLQVQVPVDEIDDNNPNLK
jgi:hypothetical protein